MSQVRQVMSTFRSRSGRLDANTLSVVPTEPPDFEEKSFEGAVNAELARDRGRVFTPGQVEEAILGYDAAAVPGDAARETMRRIAGIDMPPGV
jgi:hypothetical protein